MASLPRVLDYTAYLKTPEIMRRYDIVDGVWRFMSPAPDYSHQRILLRTALLLDRHVSRYQLGEVCPAPTDVIITKNPLRTRQPDVMYISSQRLHLVRGAVHGGPDLVVEIISPGNTLKQIQAKLRDYASIGVREAWLVDPKARTIGVWHPEAAEFHQTAVCGLKNLVRSRVLPRLRLSVCQVFQ